MTCLSRKERRWKSWRSKCAQAPAAAAQADGFCRLSHSDTWMPFLQWAWDPPVSLLPVGSGSKRSRAKAISLSNLAVRTLQELSLWGLILVSFFTHCATLSLGLRDICMLFKITILFGLLLRPQKSSWAHQMVPVSVISQGAVQCYCSPSMGKPCSVGGTLPQSCLDFSFPGPPHADSQTCDPCQTTRAQDSVKNKEL
jgi:hypothetical protein